MFMKNDGGKRDAMWGDHKKFTVLKNGVEQCEQELKELKVDELSVFDECGDSIAQMEVLDKLTLLVFPLVTEMDDKGKETRKKLKEYSLRLRALYYPIDLRENGIAYNHEGLVRYYPSKNLIVSLVNPFGDNDVWEAVKEDIKDLKAEYKDKEQIQIQQLADKWSKGVDKQINECNQRIDGYKSDLEHYKKCYFDAGSRLTELKLNLESLEKHKGNAGQYVIQELAKIKALPMVKEFSVGEVIKLSFGDVYCHGTVMTGKKKVDGCTVPVMENKKVFIGNLKFEIKDNKIRVFNDNDVNGREHPHAEGGRICFGEADWKINDALVNFELVKAIKLLYSWAFSYNKNDAYMKLQHFYNKEVGKNWTCENDSYDDDDDDWDDDDDYD